MTKLMIEQIEKANGKPVFLQVLLPASAVILAPAAILTPTSKFKVRGAIESIECYFLKFAGCRQKHFWINHELMVTDCNLQSLSYSSVSTI